MKPEIAEYINLLAARRGWTFDEAKKYFLEDDMSKKMSLMEALIIIQGGWDTDEEHKVFLEAKNIVRKESTRLIDSLKGRPKIEQGDLMRFYRFPHPEVIYFTASSVEGDDIISLDPTLLKDECPRYALKNCVKVTDPTEIERIKIIWKEQKEKK